MQYALLNGSRELATKGQSGICELCKQPVIAKCGDVKLHHWAHERLKDCDHWWELETVWHRNWKNQFPDTFREKPFINSKTGEVHRADIHTDKEITIEFQYSRIIPQEQSARENFYKNLVWVVNGTRLKSDIAQFEKGVRNFSLISRNTYKVVSPDECFPAAWMNRPIPVVFDFFNANQTNPNNLAPLYCLLPNRLGLSGIVTILSRSEFVKATTEGYWITWLTNLQTNIQQVSSELEAQRKIQANAGVNVLTNKFPRNRGRRL